MFRLSALLLVAALCLPAKQIPKRDVRAIALEIPAGASVRIKLEGKQPVQGRLAAISEEGLTVQVIVRDRIEARSVAFAEMRSIQQTNKPMGAGAAVLITFGVIYSLGVIFALAVNR